MQPLLFPEISYSFYPVYCGLYGIQFDAVPLDEQFQIRCRRTTPGPTAGSSSPTRTRRPAACWPWTRSSRSSRPARIRWWWWIEAYIDFGGETAISLVDRYPNLLVTQTLSKSRSLAGLRVGLAVGHPDLIEALERIKNSFNSYPLDRMAIVGAAAAFEDREYFDKTCQSGDRQP